MWMDVVNALFECTGGIFVAISIVKLLKEKKVRGVSWVTMAFFSTWGLWNLAYYPALGQWHSFFGGIFVTSANLTWVGLMIHYGRKEKRRKS